MDLKEIKEKLGINNFSEIPQLKMYHLSYNEKYRLFLINEKSIFENNCKMIKGFAAVLRSESDGHTYKKKYEPKVGEYEHGHIFGVELIQYISKLKTPEFKRFKNKDELSFDYLNERLVRENNTKDEDFKNIILQTDQANEYGNNNIGQAKFEQQVNTFLRNCASSKIQVYYEAEAIYKNKESIPIGTRLYAHVIGDKSQLLNKITIDATKKAVVPHIPFHIFIPNVNE